MMKLRSLIWLSCEVKRRRFIVPAAAAAVVGFAIAAGAVYKGLQAKVYAAEPLSAYVPQGSLMAVESPDFAGLLATWTNSPEEKAWIKSGNYAEFSRSRLFSRLGEAQSEFAASAGLAPDAKFLGSVAGGESLFAWYDIGKLEFLYLTRMKPGEAANSPLMKLADRFQMRKAGKDSFYIRSETGPGDAGVQAEQGAGAGSARTVAFAVHGDLLLLATREDLIANALLLAQHQGDATLQNEPWYTAAVSEVDAGAGASRPDLRMTLNLTRIVPSPYFRSYWVQRNVTEMRQYGAAVSDLYRTAGAFREERVLVPKVPDGGKAAGDLRPILEYLPADSGVYRATAMPGTAEIVDQLDRRLITRGAAAFRDLHIAPVADLSDRSAGNSGNLDTRIDEQPGPELPLARALDGLRGLIEAAHPTAMMVYSTESASGGAASAEMDPVFLPVHSAVVLSAVAPWTATAIQDALAEALRARLTVGGIGLSWQTRQQDGQSWMQVSGLQPLAMAVRGGILIVATDPETLLQVLNSKKRGIQTSDTDAKANATSVAGFSHSSEREPFRRISALLDRNHPVPGSANSSSDEGAGSPAFFSGNMGSLSDAFQALDSETFVEGPMANHAVRQTVVYQWKP